MDITAALLNSGITTPLPTLYAQIEAAFWTVKSVKFDNKRGCYVAVAENPHGERMEKTGNDVQTAVGNILSAALRRNYMRTAAQWKVGSWKMFTDQLQPIAEAYAKAPVYDQKAAAAFMELAADSVHRAQVIGQQIKVEVTDNPEPYPNAAAMCEDIHKRRHFVVSRANSEHPLWSVDQNVAFRTVHDVLGHCFVPGTMVRTEIGYRPIETIRVGERVLSSDGKFHNVKNVWSKPYAGEIVKIDTGVGSNIIRTTPNHEILSLAGGHKRSHHKNPCSPHYCGRPKRKPESYHSVEWQAAESLSVGSYLATNPMEEEQDVLQISVPDRYHGTRIAHRRAGLRDYEVTPEFLWIIGLYLAEGSCDTTKINFGLHRSEKEYQNRVVSFFEQHGYKTHYAKRPEGDNGVKIEIYGTMLAEWFGDWLGRGFANKAIPSEFMNMPVERLRHVIEGVYAGDGFKKQDGIGQGSSILALQLVEYGLRAGFQPSTSILEPSLKNQLTSNQFKTFDANGRGIRRGANKRGFWNLHSRLFTRVTSYEREQYEGTVYDLEVEGDHSYVVENIIVHNSVSGGDFGWQGENLACAAHAPLLSSTAQQALFSECIGQTAYAAYYRGFGPQKVALFPQFTNDTQDTTPSQGIHPSQSLVPVSMPSIPQSPPANTPYKPGDPAPHQLPGGLTNMSRLAALADPNVGWTPEQSGVTPMQPNAYLDHGDPMQGKAVMDNARLIDTEWAYLKDGAGQPDYARMKLAIENAFRVALLSPLKDLRWNAIHYQDISHIPGGTNNPDVYWQTLDKARQTWNVARYGEDARFAHLPYSKAMKQLGFIVYKDNPQLGHKVAEERTMQMINDWRNICEQQINEQEQLKKENKRKNATQVELAVNTMIAKHIKLYIAEKKAQHDVARQQTQEQAKEQTQPLLAAAMPPAPPAAGPTPDMSRYGGFMYGHLVAISRVSENIDTIMKAALTDVHDHDGAGHHFRATVLQLGIPGVAPKVASFIWLLLQPMTSQLGTIDTHMMDVLGHDYEADMSRRDYFKYERELAAGRDASGYGHIPLGAFQWGMWDYKRTGAGSHQDHSAMRVLDPKPHDTIDWAAKAQPQNAGNAQQFKQDWRDNPPDWWANTKPARDAVAQEYDQQMSVAGPKGKPMPRGKVPYLTVPDPVTGDPVADPDDDGTNPNQAFSKVATRGLAHWWDHEKPINEHKAHILGEYAAGCKPKLSEDDVEDFIDEHSDDVEGDLTAFKHKMLEALREYSRMSNFHASSVDRTPWFVHPLTGVYTPGVPGQPLMHHVIQATGWSTPDVWQGIEQVGKI